MAKATIAHLRNRLKALNKSPFDSTSRGFELERLIVDLLQFEGIEASGGFRPTGEQIDGFFTLDNHFFALECKWEQKEIPVSEIYAFRGKVEGKLVGTIGIFVSISNFSRTVTDVLRYGKVINVLLFNGDDVNHALSGKHRFSEILRIKLRRAAQYGEPYYPFEMYLDELRSRMKVKS